MSNTSLIFALSGNSANLEASYFPPIELPSDKSYALGLVELMTWNSIPNIEDGCNKIYFVGGPIIQIPTGSYEIEDLNSFLSVECEKYNIKFELKGNNNTLKCELKSSARIDFRKEDCIGKLLGFRGILESETLTESQELVSIINVNAVRVECNITTGAFFNNLPCHTIYEFSLSVDPGFRIVESPSPIIYLPLLTRVIDNIQLKLIDQNNKSVNLRDSDITIRLHLKSWE